MKKLYSLVIAAVAAVALSFTAQAGDSYYEVFGGLNFSTVDYNGVDFRTGVHVGLRGALEIPSVTQGFYVNAATALSYRGFKADTVSYNPCYLDIPVHAGYKYENDDRITLFAEAGPYVGIGLFGKSEGRNIFSDEVGYKRIDLGLGLRTGIEIDKKYVISVGGDFGFLNVIDINGKGAKPRNLTISFAYKL